MFKRWLAVDYPLNKKELADCLQQLMTIDVSKMKYYPDLNLQQIYQGFLKGISLVEDGRPETEIILYNLGKFSQVIGDYEVINFTLKPKSKLDTRAVIRVSEIDGGYLCSIRSRNTLHTLIELKNK